MIIKTIDYLIFCDKCHDTLIYPENYGGTKTFNYHPIREGSREHIESAAMSNGWDIKDNGKHFCLKCKNKEV